MFQRSLFFWLFHLFILISLIFCWFKINQLFGHVLMASIAAIAIVQNIIVSRKRATIDLIMKSKHLESLQDAVSCVGDMSTTEMNELLPIFCKKGKANDTSSSDLTIEEIAEEKNIKEKQFKQANQLAVFLNHYEFIAVGVKEGAFDLNIYQRMQHNTVISNWNKCRAFVIQVRTEVKQETVFQEFEWLAKKFKDNPLKVNDKHQ